MNDPQKRLMRNCETNQLADIKQDDSGLVALQGCGFGHALTGWYVDKNDLNPYHVYLTYIQNFFMRNLHDSGSERKFK